MSSADSHQQTQQQQQPSVLSQLWQNFGVGEGNTPTRTSSNNNNYVNFNQFIMQHNLNGGNNGNASRLQSGVNNGIDHVGDNLFGEFSTPTSNIKTSNAADNSSILQTNFFNSNSNLFQFNNGDTTNTSNSVYSGGAGLDDYVNSTTTTAASNNFYENAYTPFGNTGTTYYANPFATGFDFSASNLHATAPEFVPRFTNLSLTENTHNNNSNNKANINSTTTVMSKDIFNNDLNSQTIFNPSNISENFSANRPSHTGINTNQQGSDQVKKVTNTNIGTQNINGENPTTASQMNLELALKSSQSNSFRPASASASSSSSSPSASGSLSMRRSTGATNKTSLRSEALRSASSNGIFSNGGGHHGYHHTEKNEKSNSSASSNARAEREREHDNRRSYQNGNRGDNNEKGSERNERGNVRGNDRHNRGDRGERGDDRADRGNDRNNRADRGDRGDDRADRGDRYERGNQRGSHGNRGNRDRDYQRYDNHRSNKRRDDWNRNRDRINGYRVDEKYSMDNGKDSPLPSPEKKSSPKKIYPENEKLSQREKLIRDIETRRLECLVCVELIKVHHSVWSCHNCYHILHLQCIIKWASSSKSDDGWRCPACQNVVKEVPRDYYCFCGKVKNPSYNRQDTAHTCGEVCGRVEGCTHACTLLCHPGPCPPCQANVRRECGCGKTTKTMQCCLKEAIECDATCGKLLNCELHTCAVKCHEGKCIACSEKVDQHCHCSKQERQVTCTRDSHDKLTYSCGKPCGRDLACGNHKCKDCCHAGACRPCKLSPEMVTSCPCGKVPVLPQQRNSCLDDIPTCEGICSKTLRCGKAAHPHHCTNKCHLGNCPPCNKQTAVKCRCGHMDQLIKCRQLSTRADDARCKKRCVKKRSCGKHKCNQECCIDIDHICPLPCNYTLSCGKHKCDQPCHRGNCPPCYRSSFEELYCECGAEVIYPPVPCGTKRPACKRPCSRAHPCTHAPQHNCHSASTCPPCMMFTTQFCYGQHEQRKTIPCSQSSFSCGLACQKPLTCGRHKCIKSCHEGVCQQTQGEICKQSCTKLRPSCGHKCMAPCHDGDCPETPCKEMVEVQCECGNRKQQRSCHDLAREYSRIATAQLASSMAEMQRGNYMELSEILAPVKTNKTNKTLDCNDECRLLERNRRLAIGLQIRNPDLPQKLMTKYSDFIRNYAKRDLTLVKTIHDALANLVKLAKESKQKSRSHSFPTMNREKRQLVHEMCEMFGVDSVAYDAEPNRNVVATAHKDRSWLPATSIMEVMQRESGQRRVPVPSNNAWGIKR